MDEYVALSDEEGIVFLHLQFAHSLIHLVGKDFSYHRLFNMVLTTGHQRYFYTVTIKCEHGITF